MRRYPFSSYASSKSAVRRLSLVLTIAAVFAAIGLTTVFATGVSAGSITQLVAGLFSPTLPAAPSESNTVAERSGLSARSGHTATVMRDGRVLIVGGDETGSAQIFDPATGEFADAGFLRLARMGHTATLLGDGRILITGGTDRRGTSLSSTEIFADGLFTAGPDLKKARAGHTVTVLDDGQIVVIGGNAREVEVIDAAAKQSRIVKGLVTENRSNHSARLLKDGSIIVVGGRSADGEAVLGAERINPRTMEIETIGALRASRIRPVLNELPDGKVQVIGGNDEGTMEVFSPANNRFSGYGHVIPNRDISRSTAFRSGNALAGDTASDEAKVLRSASRAALMSHGEADDSLLNRSDYALVRLPNKVLVIGGINARGEQLNSLLETPETGATITTDAVDYPPDFPVIIAGTGWEPGETVQLTIVCDRVPVGEGDPITTMLSAVADENGNVLNDEFMTTQEDLGASFVLTAAGLSSGRTAQTTFTDASPGSLGNYATQGLPNSPAPTSVSPSNVASNVTFSTLTRGSGLSLSGAANAFSSSNWTGAASPDANDYYEFTIAPNAGYQFSASELRIGLQRSGTGPTSAVVRSSLDGYTANIGSVISVPTSTGTFTINLSTTTGLQNSVSPVTVRIYGYGASNSVGTMRVERVTGGTPMVGIELDGSVVLACTGPSISTNPSSETKNVGQSATFSVTATGTAPLGYQWRKGGAPISGAISSSYVIPSVVAGDAGSYDVVVTNSCGTATSTAATLTVNVATTLALAAPTPASITYGVPAPVTLTATLTPALAGQSISFTVTAPGGGTSVINGTTNASGVATASYNSASAVGTYSSSASFAGATISSVVYTASISNVQTFDVVKADQTITFGALATKTYGDAPFVVSATGGASGNPVTFAASGNCTASGTNGSTITITGAGSCTVTASQAGNTNYNAATNVQQSFTINKADTITTVTCTAGPFTYNGSAQTPCSATVTGPGGLNLTPTPTYSNNTNAGSATAGYNYPGDANYNPSSDSKNFTIGAAQVTSTGGSGSNVYDGLSHSPSACVVSGTYIGGLSCVNNPASGVGPGVGTTAILPVTSGADIANFTVTPVNGSYTISPAAVTATAGSGSGSYNGAPQSPSACAVSGAYIGSLSCVNNPASVGPGVGTTTISPVTSGADLANFTVTPVDGSYTISPALVTSTAGSGSNVYDGSTHSPSACVVSGTYIGGLSCVNNPASVGPGVGTTTILPVTSGADIANFTITPANGSYTISPAAVTATAGSGSGSYNGATQSPSACVVSGAYTGLLSCVNSPASVGPGVGTTTISPVTSGADLANFTVTNVNGSYTINPALVTATAGNGSSVYDAATHSPSACVVTGAYIGGLSCANSPSSVGPNAATYPISPVTSGPDLANFVVTPVGRSYTITKAPTVITPDGNLDGTNNDCINNTYSATLTDAVTGQDLSGIDLKMTIGTQSTTDETDAAETATFTQTLFQAPGVVQQKFELNEAWTDNNRTPPPTVTRNFTVLGDPLVGPGTDADSLYTGSSYFWTTSASSSTATLTLSATIKDSFDLCPTGDITKANVSFMISTNGGTSFSPVSSAQNLPVGLVNPNVPNVGAASAIAQYNIGSNQSVELVVRVVVGGYYTMTGSFYDSIIVIGKPGSVNSLIGAGRIRNDGSPYLASGYFGLNSIGSQFGSQVAYNNRGTNPKGQVTVTIRSCNKVDGTLDTLCNPSVPSTHHVYWIKSNSISELSKIGGAATFGGKTNGYELKPDGSKTNFDSGNSLQLVFTPNGQSMPVNTYAPGWGTAASPTNKCNNASGCASIVLFRSAGGVWYSSAWGLAAGTPPITRTVQKNVVGGNIAVN
ncbi:MAG: kelch repeat-containing protein [Pyrinomonadaceae bacterium]